MPEPRYSDRTVFTSAGIGEDFVGIFGTKDEGTYAKGFLSASHVLLNQLMGGSERKLYNAYLLLPTCYVFRHYLELQCKYLLRLIAAIQDEPYPTKKPGHNLGSLWVELLPKLRGRLPEFTETPFDSVGDIVLQFFEADETSQEFRYPTIIGGQKSLSAIPQTINLESLQSAMGRAETFFRHWTFELEGQLCEKQEAEGNPLQWLE